MEGIHGDAAAGAVASLRPFPTNIIRHQISLAHVLSQLPIPLIASFLSNTSVGFLAVSYYRSCSTSTNAGMQRHVLHRLMTKVTGELEDPAALQAYWANLSFWSMKSINDADLHDLLSLVNHFGDNCWLRRLEVAWCFGVAGDCLSPLRYSTTLESVRFCDNMLIPSRQSRRLRQGPPILEEMHTTFSLLINRRNNLMKYLRIPGELGIDGDSVEGQNIARCSETWCCGYGPIHTLHWCHECGLGPFCEKGEGQFYVYCSEGDHAYCVQCLRRPEYGSLAFQCPHSKCHNWYCSCTCHANYCGICDKDVCYACGPNHYWDGSCPYRDDCQYYHGRNRCDLPDLPFSLE